MRVFKKLFPASVVDNYKRILRTCNDNERKDMVREKRDLAMFLHTFSWRAWIPEGETRDYWGRIHSEMGKKERAHRKKNEEKRKQKKREKELANQKRLQQIKDNALYNRKKIRRGERVELRGERVELVILDDPEEWEEFPDDEEEDEFEAEHGIFGGGIRGIL
jgi:hypothetical protein